MEHKEKFGLTDVALAYMMGRDPKTDLGGNSTGFYAECDGLCDPDKLEYAINCVIKNQPMLRTVIYKDGTQAELKEIPVYHLPKTDLSSLSDSEITEYFENYREKHSHYIYPLETWPMFQFAWFGLPNGRTRVVLAFDMLLIDRFSIEIMISEMNQYYNNHPDLPLQTLLHSYQDYIELSKTVRARDYEKDKAYWEAIIPELPTAPPIRLQPGNHSGNRFTSCVYTFSEKEYGDLQEQLYDKRILPSIYLLYCYGKCLSRFSSTQDLSVSMPIADRTPMGQIFSDVVGDFTKLLLIDLHYNDESWKSNCKKLQKRVKEYMKHSAFTGLDVMKELSRREQLSGKAAFPFAFTSRLTSQDESYWDCIGKITYQISRTPQLAVDCQISEHEGTLEIRWDCLTGVLSEDFLNAMFEHFLALISGVYRGKEINAGIPDKYIEQYNNTFELIKSCTLQRLFVDQVKRTPNLPAITARDITLTYEELHKASNAVASVLHRKYGSGNTIMVEGQRCVETVVYLLGILKSGNAYVPCDSQYPQARIDTIRDKCHAADILKYEDYNALIQQGNTAYEEVKGSPEDLAYIIFTSGSTGTPKGVVITQDAVCNTIIDINQRFNVDEHDCIIGISSFWFDLSVYDVFGALSTGAHLVLAEKVDIEHLAYLMNSYPVTFWNTVPAIMGLLVDSGKDMPVDTLKNVLLSGDWIPLELPQKIWDMFPNAEVCSLGGATEGSIWSIYYPIKHIDETWKSIPYGYPLANQTIYVLNFDGELCPIGVQGEICIGGRGVAKEYCGNEAETKAHYVEHPLYGRIYKTGDYGYMSSEGYVVFIGRMDQQIKLHGFRIELGEIEAVLLKHDNVEKALAVVVKNDVGASLIAAYVVCHDAKKYDEEELLKFAAESLPEYMVPSLLINMEAFPLTANGKIDRKALPVPQMTEQNNNPPETEMEKIVAAIWQEELGITSVGQKDNFFYLGGDSLLGLRVASKIKQQLGIKVDISEIFATPVLQDFCAELEKNSEFEAEETLPTLRTNPDAADVPFALTNVQRSYWIGAQGMKNMSGVTTHAFCEVVGENLDMQRLENALNQVIAEQGMMRAVVLNDGTQKIMPEVPHYSINIRTVEAPELENTLQGIRSEMEHERFDPSKWPLFRVEAVQCGETTTVFVDLDNLIFDGFSVQLLFRRWNTYYEQEQETKKLELSFRDYVVALEELKQTERYESDRAYWQEQVKTMHSAPELFTLTSPDKLTSQSILHIQSGLNSVIWQKLQENCKKHGLTASSLLLTVYAQMLSLWSRKPGFTINLTQYNRLFDHPEINDLIGDFTLLSMLSVDMGGNETLTTYAQKVQKDLAGHMAHPYYGGVEVQQDYARVNQRDGVIFPVVFTSTVGLANAAADERMFGEVKRITTETPQVWLDCQVTELEDGLHISFEAVKELFDEKTVREMVEFYYNFLMLLSENDDAWEKNTSDVIYEHDMIPTLKEREKLSELPAVDNGLTLEQMFVEQAMKAPERVAVLDKDGSITYGELYCDAFALSQEIKKSGQKIVAVLMEKGWRQVTAVMATLMAGAAYLPLDVGNPDMRIKEILKKADTDLILTEEKLEDRVSALDKNHIIVKHTEFNDELPKHDCVCKSEDLAYIIFTSGSTGTPKGVMIDHRGAVNTILDVNERFDIGEDDKTLALSALNFDLSVYDIFGMLCCGGAIVIPSESDRKDPDRLAELMTEHGVTVWNSVPAFMQLLVDNVDATECMKKLRVVMISGDWIPLALPTKIKAAGSHVKVYSLGGATEASIWSNYYPVEEVAPEWRSVPYGYPLSGQGFRILNEKMQDCPPMVIGKLYISGVGVALGYLNDKERTDERFITYERTGERLYDTGDLGMYWEDGTMEFFGREDFQVKIRGHRIELGEIEAVLSRSKYVEEVCAFTATFNGRIHLLAAIVSDYEETVIMEDLLKEVENSLPDYMIPSTMFVTSKLPLTTNGKIDRKALLTQGELLLMEQKTEEEPVEMTDDEIFVAEIWKEVLSLDELPALHEDFFDYGGDSLDIVKVRTKIVDKLGCDIEMADIFNDPTVFGMAKLIK